LIQFSRFQAKKDAKKRNFQAKNSANFFMKNGEKRAS